MMGETMEKKTLREWARDLNLAFQVAGIDPGKDSIVEAVQKMRKLNLRHLVVYIEDGGCLCLCADPEMSAMLHNAINRYDAESGMESMEEKHDKERVA